jgi:hypothetical protein
MTSEKCETHLYLTLDVLGRINKNMHLLELPSPVYYVHIIYVDRKDWKLMHKLFNSPFGYKIYINNMHFINF